MNVDVVVLFRYSEGNQSGDDCHGKDNLLLTVPKREKGIPCRVTPENPEVGEGRRKRGLEELVGKPLLWFSQE